MAVRHEIKSQLAKLLATEDLIVEHKKVETACFNVHTRVLTLPMWDKASNTVYDLLVGHEVGHALFTPDEDWIKQRKIPPQFVNVVEDARIEKLMKRRYAGLAKTFFNGYKELSEQDFFSIEDLDIATFNLADRVNLHFKIGNFNKFDFTVEEQNIINQISVAETFSEVLDAAEVLYNYCKCEQKVETKLNSKNEQGQSETFDGNSSDFDDRMGSENDQPKSTGEDGSGSESENGSLNQQQDQFDLGGEENSEPEVKTMESLEEALRNLVSFDGYENVYLEIPHLDLNKIIVQNKEIHDRCKLHWEEHIKICGYSYDEVFGEVDKSFTDFKRSAQKEVNYLVKEFECKKSADSYARMTSSRTGILDCTKLHTYKYNEDLFKKITTLADGKNHGLIFVLDWSGSMSNVLLDTIKQLYNLIWFCKKVSIPFEVYAFTQDYPIVTYDSNGRAMMRDHAYTKKDGQVQICEWFTMMNLLTSKVNAKTLDEQMKNIYKLAYSFSKNYYAKYSAPNGMSLSGTPLNEALISLNQILPKFKKENKLQKVQCIVLTDGEACQIKCHREVKRHWESEPYVGTCHIGQNAFLRDRKTGNTYSFNVTWYQYPEIFLRNLRDRFSDVNFIGIRVLESRDAGSFLRNYFNYGDERYDKIMSIWKKERSFAIKNSGYHTYFGISSNVLSQDSEFDVAEDASKAQIKSAFAKSLKSKKMNKKILGEFIQLIV